MKTGHFLAVTETSEFYFVASSVQVGMDFGPPAAGPALKDMGVMQRRSRSAVTAAVSPSSLPQSSTGRFDVRSVDARSYRRMITSSRSSAAVCGSLRMPRSSMN